MFFKKFFSLGVAESILWACVLDMTFLMDTYLGLMVSGKSMDEYTLSMRNVLSGIFLTLGGTVHSSTPLHKDIEQLQVRSRQIQKQAVQPDIL